MKPRIIIILKSKIHRDSTKTIEQIRKDFERILEGSDWELVDFIEVWEEK